MTDTQIVSVVNMPRSEIVTKTELEGWDAYVFDKIIFDTTYTPTWLEEAGTIYRDETNKTYTWILDNGVAYQFWTELYTMAQNDTGNTIANGTPVMYWWSIWNSWNIRIVKAIADWTIPAWYMLWITTETIDDWDSGMVTWRGKVRWINTTWTPYWETWSAWDLIWVSATTAWYLTKTMPEAPNYWIFVWAVVNAHANVWTIDVWTNISCKVTDLSDVNWTALTVKKQIMVWDNTNKYFDFTEVYWVFWDKAWWDYTEFDADWTMQAYWDATCYEDLRIEPTARNTWANAPTFEKRYDDSAGTSRWVFLYSFDDAITASEKEVFFTMQMPHAWELWTAISMHVHRVWNTDDTDATPIRWLEYTRKDIWQVYWDTTIVYSTGENIDSDWTPDPNVTAGKHYIWEFADLVPWTTADWLSSIIIWRLFRRSWDASDTYDVAGNKCGLLYIDAHYKVNTLWSRQEYVK
jgi:hypothetical protein